MIRFWISCLLLSFLFCDPWQDTAPAAEPLSNIAPLVQRATHHLASSQAEDGSYSSHLGTGVASLVTTGLMRCGRTPQDPLIAKSLAYLERHVREDGGIYQSGSRYRNYETCLAILCFDKCFCPIWASVCPLRI